MNIPGILVNYFPCLAVKKKELPPPPPSINWSRVAKIALIGAGAIAIGVAAYHLYNDLPKLNNDELIRALRPICRDAVKNYCKIGPDGKEACLKDYLVENWTPFVSMEYNQYILCPVDIKSTNCSALVGQPSVDNWLKDTNPFVFIKNYETISAKIPDHFSTIFRRAIERFHAIKPGTIGFKSHIYCQSA